LSELPAEVGQPAKVLIGIGTVDSEERQTNSPDGITALGRFDLVPKAAASPPFGQRLAQELGDVSRRSIFYDALIV
jgi:hypothetical protein